MHGDRKKDACNVRELKQLPAVLEDAGGLAFIATRVCLGGLIVVLVVG